ncbi:MAG: hypothetical protein KID00_05720 [Clostridium argentinense]|uniref:DUF4367 domain-containing protein n=1 Tax=Clostridium faecium TaxID=2762223 RepID=A0ABR8YUS6_9CLOT|nr:MULTISPECIES: hypothetical protein [Clostridium]MBD8047696.1 hypothetical protein [Clostridium faecium]MBS5823347.1 hypothetical protein [Clostridium argentinense]MDU1348040.1 hypothetical protein [Clostridium argentinense]
MKDYKKSLFILFFCISILLNTILVAKMISPNNYERSIIGCYQNNNKALTLNFFKDNTLRISTKDYYIETKYNKIGENMYVFKENENVYFVFWYDKSFNLFNSDSESVMKLEKISNQTMIDVNLKEKNIE